MADTYSGSVDSFNFERRSWVEPTFGENTEEDKGSLEGIIIHNPDGSDIKVDLSKYIGHNSLETYFSEGKEMVADFMDGPPKTYTQGALERIKDGLLASTSTLRETLIEGYVKVAATKEGTEFFTQNAKHVFADYDAPLDSEVSWVSPQPSKNPQAGWEKGEMTGNMLNTQLSEQYNLIFANHRGVADANLQAGQEKPPQSLDDMSEAERAAMVIKALQAEPYLTPEQKATMIEMVKESPVNEVTTDQEATEEALP